MNNVIALIDGEHYPPVVKSALDWLGSEQRKRVVAAVFLGGEEKIRGGSDHDLLGVPVLTGDDTIETLVGAIRAYGPQEVVDLSDEPVVGYRERFELASRVLLEGVSYVGADFRFDPPSFADVVSKPSLSIVGLGKRVGKTSLSAHIARELKAQGHDLVVVAMGRGGPAKPEVLDGANADMNSQFLLDKSEEGKHAASDYFEDALMSGVRTVGCRRCGGGMAGQPFVSNVLEGARIADDTDADLVVLEGSGAAMPPVRADAYVTVASAAQPIDYFSGYFGPYRILLSDLIVLTGCELPLADADKVDQVLSAISGIKPELPVIRTIFRPNPLDSIEGARVFFATTADPRLAPSLTRYLEETFSCEVVKFSSNLSRADKLSEEMGRLRGAFDTVLTELKAAGVDVATKLGAELGARIVYADNVPQALGKVDMDRVLGDLAAQIMDRSALGTEGGGGAK